MKGKRHSGIDLLKLYATGDQTRWNEYLNKSYRTNDIKGLAQTRYELQVGMRDLAKKKLNSEKMIVWFIRLQNSLEITIKKIVRKKAPNPCDDPLKAALNLEHKNRKTIRDQELELFFKKTGY